MNSNLNLKLNKPIWQFPEGTVYGNSDSTVLPSIDISDGTTLNLWLENYSYNKLVFHKSGVSCPFIQLKSSTTIVLCTAGGSSYTFNVASYSLNSRIMFTFVFKSTGCYCLVNNVMTSSGAQPMTLGESFNRLGAGYVSSGFEFNGTFYMGAYYNTELTPLQISNLYNSGEGNPQDIDESPAIVI